VVTVDGTLPTTTVKADEMLDSVVHNLLTNAVVHNDSDTPEIEVSMNTHGDSVTLQIADNGPGIPEDKKDSIFAKGEKGLNSSGTGLGLYLIRTLVEQYGGSVDVADNQPQGSVFTVELPLS
jgi:signal transduction histidine kinase